MPAGTVVVGHGHSGLTVMTRYQMAVAILLWCIWTTEPLALRTFELVVISSSYIRIGSEE